MARNKIFQLITTGATVLAINGCAETQYAEPAPAMASSQQVLSQKPVEAPAAPQPPIVNSRHVTLTDLNLNSQGNQIIIKPGKTVTATLNYAYNCQSCKPNLSSQIIIGLANRSAQACIYNGGAEGQGSANFELRVPVKPGKYEIRFRAMQAADCAEALKTGWGSDNSPSKETTIGRIIASKKAEA
jgi:hypothetical protein